jgi:PEP-CTERM motif
MRKTLMFAGLAGFALLLTCVPAMANANMNFSNAGSNSYNGVPSYPYYLSVNGGPLQFMMCLGYNEHISGGETWMATVAPVGSLDLATHLVDYQAAYLFTFAVADQGADSDLNAAIWYLYEGVPTLDTGAANYVALAQGMSYSQGEFPNVVLYTAIPGTESGTLGTAQNFFGTPEPGSLLLVGTGLLGAAGMVRRKFNF